MQSPNRLYSGLLARSYDVLWRHFTERSAEHVLAIIGTPWPSTEQRRPRILDAGCGTGYLLDQLQRRFPDAMAVGLDESGAMLSQAARRLGPNAALVTGVVCARPPNLPPFRTSSFDLVVASNLLHYFPDPAGSIAALAALLRPHGRMVVEDYAHRPSPFPWRTFERLIRLVDRGHVRAHTLEEAARMCVAAGLDVEKTDAFAIDRLWHGWAIRACLAAT